MTTKSSWPALNPPTPGRLSNTPTTCSAGRRRGRSCRSDRCRSAEQQLDTAVWPSTTTFFRYWTSVPLKNRPSVRIEMRVPSAKFSVVPKTISGRRLRVAVEDALLRRRAEPAGAELDVDELNRRSPALDRARIRDRQVRPLHQLGELGAAREAGEAEALDEDDVRADRADHVAQRLVEAADHRRHADDRRDADDDAEHGQRRAHLVACARCRTPSRRLRRRRLDASSIGHLLLPQRLDRIEPRRARAPDRGRRTARPAR